MSVDAATQIGTVTLPAPILTASGTAGHGAELGHYFDLGKIGAVVVKSLSADPWEGNPAPRVHPVGDGMLNSVGLQNPGVDAWLRDELPPLLATGARVVASIWGFTLEQYEAAARALASAPDGVVAVEVNLSCPNIERRRDMFAHDPELTRAAMQVAAAAGRPRWAKLSPNVTDIVEIAAAAVDGGADALTLVNTVMGLSIDIDRRIPSLGAGGGGFSGPPVHPVAVRAVWDVSHEMPTVPIIGVGGVSRGRDAVELMMAGASAVGVGTATFHDPRAPERVQRELLKWCAERGLRSVGELRGAAHA
ncbi:MAG: dihydroorotate dehydrogenase [Acidimicrobiales bacterium]